MLAAEGPGGSGWVPPPYLAPVSRNVVVIIVGGVLGVIVKEWFGEPDQRDKGGGTMLSQATIPLWTAVAALAASLSAVMAAIYTGLTYRLVRAQGEPKVVAYVRSDPDRQTVLMIRVENIGRDIATDVAFTASRQLPAKAYGLSAEDAKPAEVMTAGPLIHGIPVLGPGDSRDITWGQFGGLLKALGTEPIDLEFTYRHGRRRLSGHSRLEVASYVGTDASENPSAASARSLEKIANAAQVIVNEVRLREAERRRQGSAV